ncbi:shikimate kinase [Parabacteroides sp. PM5-20]|nr:shikimate kinase [Parabacteroides sp. PM5-20]
MNEQEKTYICRNYWIKTMKRIFLIGYMGAGKTTVGKELAKQTGLTFIDLDGYIEARFHKTVGQLFQEKGEVVFREIEQKMLQEVAAFEDVLVSTGGGAPCYFDNMEYMNACGKTIYLKVSVEELSKRLEVGKQVRPVLKGRVGEELKLFIEESLQKREGFYKQAHLIFDAELMLTEKDIQSITHELSQWISGN